MTDDDFNASLRAYFTAIIDEIEGVSRDVGPTTACFECGSIMPIGDTYLSKVDQRALCEGCFSSRKDRRLAKEVPG